MGSQRTPKATKKEMSDEQKNLNAFLLNSEKSFQDFAFFRQGSRMGSQGIIKGTKRKMSVEQKNNNFLLNFRRSYQGFTFSTRIQDGIPSDNQMDKKTKRLTCRKKPSEFLLKFMKSYHDFIFPPGLRIVSQRTTKATKRYMFGRQKNLIFLLNSKESFQDLNFHHQDAGWYPKGQPKGF